MHQPYRFGDGLEVEVVEITFDQLGDFQDTTDPTATKGDPYVIVTVQIANHSPAEIEIIPLYSMGYGPQKAHAAEVVTCCSMIDMRTLRPGESPRADVGFIVPAQYRDDVVLEVSVGPSRDRVQFAGSVADER